MTPAELGRLRPPRRLAGQSGAGDFAWIGSFWLERLIRWAEVRPDAQVLEVGCGIGRVAAALASFLEAPGRYDAFDVDRRAVRWCRRAIASQWPLATFRYVDVANPTYRPRGRIDPRHFRFPYDDASFDLVIATSVYTHMGHDETGHYLTETARVLRPGGRSFATFFLVGDGTPDEPQSGWDFPFRPVDGQETWSAYPDRPMLAVAHRLDSVEALHAAGGLDVDDPIRFGAWRIGDTTGDYQDVVVSRRADR